MDLYLGTNTLHQSRCYYLVSEAKCKLVVGLMALNWWYLVVWHACVCIVDIVFMKCQGCINVTKRWIVWHQSAFCCQHQRLLMKMLIGPAAEYILFQHHACPWINEPCQEANNAILCLHSLWMKCSEQAKPALRPDTWPAVPELNSVIEWASSQPTCDTMLF